ncbi:MULTISPECIES: DUF3574 domain-containing protein [Caballeronia]|uniref:DUF3574 domain-containing protein n=1 Tax=Caballeronia novacaledonica TaxID=1544861 RepID=A0AA37ICD3_9BURK|nr:DUF3574 domain-containing protein [Caballeronia novacaledonica]GJH27265.1 DUF3574 domain-containing protein [Caballeronia novacaledonica]
MKASRLGFGTIALLMLAPLLSSCTTLIHETCATGEQRVVNDLVYFGTAKPVDFVTPAEFDDFLRTEVTPRFPQGFTTWRASGQWRAADGSMVHEPTWVLSLAHPDDAASDKAIGEIREHYRARFEQESTLRVRHTACASF